MNTTPCPFKTFFTSDLHFGHRNVIKYSNRPFASEQEMQSGIISDESVNYMNETLVLRWNETVGLNDIVYVLGDFAMGHKDNVLKYGSRLNGTKLIIPGNHDKIHPVMHKNKPQRIDSATELWTQAGFHIRDLQEVLELPYPNKEGFINLNLCHFPYKKDHTPSTRYKEYRPVDQGEWLLHGHIHELWKVDGKQINVGVDVWDFRPVSIAQIKEIISLYFKNHPLP